MTADLTAQTITIPPYTLSVSAGVTATHVTATLVCESPLADNDPRAPDNLMVWVDGQLATVYHAQTPQVARTRDGDAVTYAVSVPRDGLDLSPEARLNLSLWTLDATRAIGYFRLTLPVPPQPLPAVAPGLVIRTMFNLPPHEVTPEMVPALKAAGINALSGGVFNNPGDNPTTDTLEKFLTIMNTYRVRPALQFCRDHGFKYLGMADDFFRTENERAFINTSPWAADAVRATGELLEEFSDVVVGVEMFDEAPADPLSDPAYGLVVGWLRETTLTPLAWPNQLPYAWESPAFADYASRFHSVGEWRQMNEDGPSLEQLAAGVARAAGAAAGTQPPPAGWPWLCLVSCAGPYYTKRAEGGEYQPGLDELLQGGVRDTDIVAQVWLALAYGASGVRVYGYDWDLWANHRANDPVGTAEQQTGAKPGDARWPGVVAGLKSVEGREAAILSGFRPPERIGPFVYARRDAIAWAVNVSELPATLFPEGGRLVTPAGEVNFDGGEVPPGGVVIYTF